MTILTLFWLAGAAFAAPVLEFENVEKVTLETCLARRDACWRVVEKGFGAVFTAELSDVEAAIPGRYFPEAVTFVKREIDAEGHFLDVKCPGKDGRLSPCGERRDQLELRLAHAVLLRTLPGAKLPPYYDEETLEPTARGSDALKKIRKTYPDLTRRFARLIRAAYAHRNP